MNALTRSQIWDLVHSLNRSYHLLGHRSETYNTQSVALMLILDQLLPEIKTVSEAEKKESQRILKSDLTTIDQSELTDSGFCVLIFGTLLRDMKVPITDRGNPSYKIWRKIHSRMEILVMS